MLAARVAVFMAFALNGVTFGSWAPRVPALADQVDAAVGTLGLALLGTPVGLVAAGSVAGRICAAVGARTAILAASVAGCVLLPILGLVTSPLWLGVVLVLLGAVNGVFDVAMNVAAVTVVRETGRPLMPVFHAGFSFGTLTGSAGAAVAASVQWTPLRHLTVVAAVALLATAAIVRRVPVEQARRPPSPAEGRPDATVLARRPVLWLLGFVALCAAVAEGASAEWSAYFGVHQRGLDEASGAAIFSAFSVAMAVTRLLGERVERRWSPERMLVAGSTVAGAGLLLVVLVPHAVATYAGFGLAGLGLAYAFPTTLALAGMAGRRADGGGGEREIGFVTTIAYTGFFAGPPLIGGIAHLTNLDVALGVVGVVVLAIGPLTLAAASARRRENVRASQAEAGSARSW